eukprot:CAMPEP_0176388960 /NCGR_PEP_ID=MMETSP0126-20121128/37991_1 /TAXON_ID=141414 ORGANISM="Strombidinopsis acuminatum, Strain SPMC142" /NCGR_SAMPLE_ID=MMETSP0126 /ASSEMBLY_ACC=CAM_ASM_000229 /LENGTH=91 /DNA_ID=CAMNT_0017757481 /DNA_START=1011 /DNA_END=1286 /DNA_ORIENTATION=+
MVETTAVITTIQIIEMKEIEVEIVHLIISANEVMEVSDQEEVMIITGLEGIEEIDKSDAGVDLGIESNRKTQSRKVTQTLTLVEERMNLRG